MKYATDPAIKHQRIGSVVDDEHLGHQFWRGCAGFICDHTESKARPCANCIKLLEPLVKPIIRFVRNAAMGNREDTLLSKADGYAALGAALDSFLKEVNYVVRIAGHPAAAAQAYEEARRTHRPAPPVYRGDPRAGPGGSSPDHGAVEQVSGGDLPGRPDTAIPQADGADQ